nr:glycosyltransferase family 4 protein [Rhodovulum sp. P5]
MTPMNRAKTAPAAQAGALPRIAYLVGQFPEASLTFITREIEELRALGAEVLTCSIRKTPPVQHPGASEKAMAETTFNVLAAARNPLRFAASLVWLARRPRRALAALKLALATSGPGPRAMLYQIIYFIEAAILARHLERQGVGHVHSHFVVGNCTVAMLVAEMTAIRFSFTLHGPADLFEPFRWRLDEKVARADFVSTISYYARSQIMFFSDPAHWEKIRIIHCGVRPALYETPPGPPIPPRAEGEIRLLFVGRLAPVKGLRVLLEALAELAPEIPGLRLVLVGDGPDRARLEEAAAPLGDRVTFTGYLSQDEVAGAMQGTDICVLPSFAEGVPVVLMEAFASAKPVIATQVAGVGELVAQGESGLIVPPGDRDSLIAAIRKLAADPDLRARMGAAGRAKVVADFDISVEASRLARLFAGQAGDAVRPDPLS